MRKVFYIVALCWNMVHAEEQPQAAPFQVESVIDASVADLPAPRWYPEVVSWTPAINSTDEMVQKHVVQGIALIHAGWDFEAYRHFVEAIKVDPECLMAYWGISLSLASPNSEITEERFAAIERMLDLANEEFASESERHQAEALAFIFSEEPERVPMVFAAVAEAYPNNLQMALMASFMKRDGYDSVFVSEEAAQRLDEEEYSAVEFGPGPGQRQAVTEVEEILGKHPDSQMALSFWIALHAENPDGAGELRKKVLPRVRSLAKSAPGFPPYHELLGHFEWRSGNLSLAKTEFEQAIALYEKLLKEDGVSYADCPNLIRAQIYLATVCKSMGDMEGALKVAESLRALSIDDERLASPGVTLLLWEGKTLGARLYLARGEKGDFKAGLEELPSQREGESLSLRTPAVMAWEAWRQALAARNAIDSHVFDSAVGYLEALAASDSLLNSAGPVVAVGSGRQEWIRTRKALKVEWMLAKAALLVEGEEEGGKGRAGFWLQSAVDQRENANGTSPPMSLTSPRLALARFESSQGEFDAAKGLYQAAMKELPNDVFVLSSYAKWLEERGESEVAASIRKHLNVVKGGS